MYNFQSSKKLVLLLKRVLPKLVIVSLLCQIEMVVLAYVRKIAPFEALSLSVWLTELFADICGTTALTIAAREYGNNLDSEHGAYLIWAMCILLHLGGPDSISAVSLHDYDKWLTHSFRCFLQILVALYLLLRSWGRSYPFWVALPLFIAGGLKYGEKCWVLRSLTAKVYNRSLKQDKLKKGDRSSGNVLLVADFLFDRLKFLSAGKKLPISEGELCRKQIESLNSPQLAFRTVEIQLGLLHDMLYTKAIVIYSTFGIFVRFFSFLASVLALVFFSSVGQTHNSFGFVITYVSLCGAVAIECWAIASLIQSDWTKVWLLRRPKTKLPFINKLVHALSQEGGRRWSRTTAGFNLIRCCAQDVTEIQNHLLQNRFPQPLSASPLLKTLFARPVFPSPFLCPEIGKPQGFRLKLFLYQKVDVDLLVLIYNHLKERIEISDNINDSGSCNKLLNYRGDFVLNKIKCLEDFRWSTIAVQFDHSLLLWHIAIDICYHDDAERPSGVDRDTLNKYSKISKCLSDYMLYLLDMHPDSLPKHTDKRRYRGVLINCIDEISEKGVKKEKACKKLLHSYLQGMENKPILFDGCRLAMQLQSLKPPDMENWGCKEKWDMINIVWVELLTYAAAHCRWEQHTEHLRKGGELITHVCLLMANLGLSPQYYS